MSLELLQRLHRAAGLTRRLASIFRVVWPVTGVKCTEVPVLLEKIDLPSVFFCKREGTP